MSKPTITPVVADSKVTHVTNLIGALAERGRRFTDARNATIAHALATGVKQTVIVTESKVDKGDVSRINKLVTNLAPARLKALKAIALTDVNPDDLDTLKALVAFGETNLRRVKATGAKSAPSKAETADESSDPLAALHAWLLNSTPEQYEARTALVLDVLAQTSDESARAAALEAAAA